MPFGYDSRDSMLRFRTARGPMMISSKARSRVRKRVFRITFAFGIGLCLSFGTAGLAAAQTEAPAPSEAPGEAATETPGTETAGAAGTVAGETAARALEDTDYGVGLRSLEEQVNDLKEKVFKSKARLVLLRETVLNGVISGARAVIRHRNEMGASFTLERASYSLDGEPLFNKSDDDGSLDGQTEIDLFEGSIVPGTHNLSVTLVYRGNGYGIFTYLRDYTFKIRASYPFTAEEGKVVSVRAVAYERGGITTDLQDRPSMRFETEVKQDIQAAGEGRDESAP